MIQYRYSFIESLIQLYRELSTMIQLHRELGTEPDIVKIQLDTVLYRDIYIESLTHYTYSLMENLIE